MNLVDLITYAAVILYVLLGWLGRNRRKQNAQPQAKPKREPSIEELQAWRGSLGIPEPEKKKKHHQNTQKQKVANPTAGAIPKKQIPQARIKHPKAPIHQRRMPHNFRFQATLDKYKRATNIDTRDYSSRIEKRKAPVDEMVSAQLKDDAPENAYRLDKTQEKSIGWRVLHELSSKKDLIVITELLGKPRCYYAPTHPPGNTWKSTIP